jgi:hypothetical protein
MFTDCLCTAGGARVHLLYTRRCGSAGRTALALEILSTSGCASGKFNGLLASGCDLISATRKDETQYEEDISNGISRPHHHRCIGTLYMERARLHTSKPVRLRIGLGRIGPIEISGFTRMFHTGAHILGPFTCAFEAIPRSEHFSNFVIRLPISTGASWLIMKRMVCFMIV